MTSIRGIILIEGADSSGKSTLARALVERYDAAYLHSTVRRDIWRWHVGALRYALRLADTRLVVLDRLWPSELCYGEAYRGGPAIDVDARHLDRVLRRAATLIVLCSPNDQRRQAADWIAGRAAGKHEHFNRVREVIVLYADLAAGNVARPGTGYLSQLIRFQDFAARDDVLVYDRYRWEHRAKAFAERAVEYLGLLRASAPPSGLHSERYNLTGRVDPRAARRVLLVGDAISPRWLPTWPRWPFADRDACLSAATWLNRAIHSLGWNEATLTITNAAEPDDHLPELLAGDRFNRVVALGQVATRRLQALGQPHATITHPQHHRRFNHGEGPAGYARLLEEATR